MSNIVILEEENPFGVFDNSGGIRSEEELDWNKEAILGKEGTGLGSMESGFHCCIDGQGKERRCTGAIWHGGA
jgi:hypothetical protein